MASKAEVICLLFACFFVEFFAIGSATYCSRDRDCGTWSGKSCCSDRVCRKTCSRSSCSRNLHCDTGEECCNGKCSSVCTVWNGGVLAGTVVSLIVFFASIITTVACYFCTCCPYYRHRSRGRVAPLQPGHQPFVSTTQTWPTQQMQQYPPPGNYNQLAPGYTQPPPRYPNYPEQPAQYPPPQAQGQPPVPPPVSN